LKPEGTSSALLGCASGKHRRHARRYIRRVQANANELPVKAFAAANPSAVEASQWREGDLVLKFAIESPEGALTRATESAQKQLEDVVLLQRAWIEPGKNISRCSHIGLQNSVSNTVTVRDHEWEAVKGYIYNFREAFAGVSLLPASGDLDYVQAPFVSVDEPERVEELAEWEALRESFVTVDYSSSDGSNTFTAEPACGAGGCEI
jgi:ribonucleoside-diphosphate reductase alpha chain